MRETLTVEEGRRVLGLGRTAMYEAVRRGQVPALRIGRKWVIPKAAMVNLLSNWERAKRNEPEEKTV